MNVAIRTDEFVIIGPTLAPGNNVLAAIHSLYYLPENYTLVFVGPKPVDDALYKEVLALVQRDELGGRVRFTRAVAKSNAVILPHLHKSRAKNSVTGDSPEALASAILDISRSA